ncbi:hypothetical protein HanRHA438_Chr17g0806891 [Helianthus annuus]|nr:hypothetical protein HanIR_Chr17g0864421 [Helianthus annuus]KAJ0825773.1 hypothetical protein HanRHA438_Chr17g0806891 [Helianthus annuus]
MWQMMIKKGLRSDDNACRALVLALRGIGKVNFAYELIKGVMKLDFQRNGV